ncbi:hypothetical protein CBW24_06550 [Pacificitalea manganoxidans]|uniref:Sulfotransferase family protein n=1 Tax=Pacificitalea manganoxidans TaxID=1411902 RepID=A0A291LYD8_9RHOB|nr:sulfotransferase [Pacificitalea manganoxidans]ATI41690.1 hypothetical protein CBW24_06550 [Pacificitalea manganoxidans]MDR6309140.1 hypothetical protein [Pacificitalea manganoxidans]OWU71132.1 hypothetical protein ATO2_02140 [Roseovarius sp. 22II1-1F6A]
MAEPVLMFGVGATKAGTSWLYRYLAEHPDCAMPAVKELHFFNTLENGQVLARMDQLTESRTRHRERMRKAENGTPKFAAQKARVEGHDQLMALIGNGLDVDRYMAWMSEIRGDRALVGDITPAYSLMGEKMLRRMAGLRGGMRPRFVFLMRDPVARLWSNVRMVAARRVGSRDQGKLAQAAVEEMRAALDRPRNPAMLRSDYAGMIARLDRAVPAEATYLGFYEELFSKPEIDRLCAFLGLRAAPAKFDRIQHAGVHVDLPEDLAADARRALAPQYTAVEARMGRIPAKWNDMRMKVQG